MKRERKRERERGGERERERKKERERCVCPTISLKSSIELKAFFASHYVTGTE
jgi:hypothetical protein